MVAAAVSNEAVAQYLPMVNSLARRFNGVGGAEFDDLVQEGSIRVFLNLRDGKPVSTTAVKNAMRDYVRKSYRRGFADGSLDEEE